jgi:predicted phage terminase large subunit-like protein
MLALLDAVNRSEQKIDRWLGKAQPSAPKSGLSFSAFLKEHAPYIAQYSHIRQLIEALQAVADGKCKRLMVFMPPRHGKSEIVSRWFPAYLLYRFPEKWVAIASYAAGLAYTLSRNARDNYQHAGGALKDGAAGVEQWETGRGGGLWAAGVGGPATGKGAHYQITDDPLKNAEEAASVTVREKHKDWWRSTWYTRQEPDAALVVVQTRWHDDDLSGWLLSEEQGDMPEGWHIVSMAAIKGEMPEVPPTCTLEPDDRAEGAALCPERYDLGKLEAIRARVGGYYWSALYQQTPRPREGGMFRREWFPIIEATRAIQQRVRWWDKGATSGGGDYTVGLLMAYDGAYWTVEDVIRGRWSSHDRDEIIKQTAAADAALYENRVHVWTEQEPGSSGKDVAGTFVKMLAGYPVSTEPTTKSKELIADPLASQCEAGNVRLLKGAWNREYIEEMISFPHGANDDQVDASARAFLKLADTGPLRRSRRAA